MIIRQGTLSDVQEISRIHALSWKQAYRGVISQEYLDNLQEDFWVEAFTNWISNGKVKVSMLYDGKIPVGCIAYGKAREESKVGWGEIISIYLLPDYCGRGLGELLLDSAIEDLCLMGMNNVYLWVLQENLPAQRFYGKQGFAKTEDQFVVELGGKHLVDLRYINCS